MPDKFVVISREHHLLPYAHRLRNIEKQPVELVVWKSSFENAWDGLLKKDLLSSKKEIHQSAVKNYVDRAKAGEIVVICDVPTLHDAFDDADYSYPAWQNEFEVYDERRIRLGCWWSGTAALAPHLLVYDMGVWPGGMGRLIPGGTTLVRVDENGRDMWDVLFAPIKERLTSLPFKGLMNVSILEREGQLSLGGWELGWPFLQTEAFLGDLTGPFHKLLQGEVVPKLGHKFTSSLPVSVPPWPPSGAGRVRGNSSEGIVVEGLTPKMQESVFWYDVEFNLDQKLIQSAGLDGLIGVVHGSANVAEGARSRALMIAGAMNIQERQFRVDVGATVPMVLAGLEEQFGVVL